MNLKDLPWMTIGKVVGAAVIASGLVGTGYVAAPKETQSAGKVICEDTIIRVEPKVYIDGQEVKKR